MVQVVPFTGTLPHSGKHRVTTMGLGHVVDQLHDQHSLAYTSATKQTCDNVGAGLDRENHKLQKIHLTQRY